MTEVTEQACMQCILECICKINLLYVLQTDCTFFFFFFFFKFPPSPFFQHICMLAKRLTRKKEIDVSRGNYRRNKVPRKV